MTTDQIETAPSVLIATDDHAYATVVAQFLEVENYAIERCHDAPGVLRLAGQRHFDVVVLDLHLGDEEAGVDLVSFIRHQNPSTQIILVFDVDQIERAVEGIRRGAFFYLPRSCQPSDVSHIVEKAIQVNRDQAAIGAFERRALEDMIGDTPAMKRVVELITKVSPTDSTVLLLGESGTGKEVLANIIHRLSARRDKPFIAINCAALPENLLESELFGHKKGAFTGADSDKTGLFETADGGTLFLDEVGDMALVTQAKLLRVLQDGEIRRVGDTKIHHIDVRILAATNKNMVEAVAEKTFREDLYFRLNVIQITIPPLRERPEAIPPLIKEFLPRFAAEFGKNVQGMDEQTAALLQHYAYPGNIRELESIVAHAVILSESDTIHVDDLPDSVRFGDGARLALPHHDTDTIPTLQEMEKRLIETALVKLNWNQTEVARKMGVSRSTLWRKMKEFNIAGSPEGRNAVKNAAP